MTHVDVCVVGAGPGGALLSYLLAKQGKSVLLIERTNTLAKAFRGEHINEEGEAILKAYGLYEEIEQLGLLKMETLEYWHHGQCFKTIVPEPSVGHLGIHVPQAHLLHVIIEKAKELPTFQLCLNTSLHELICDDEGRYIGVELRCGTVKQTVWTDWIVGADGRYSTVRKKAAIATEIRKHGYDLLWARIPQPANWTPSIKMAYIDGQQISIFTQALGYIQIGWNIEQGTFPQLRKQSFQPFIDQLTAAFPMLHDTVAAHIQSWDDFVLLDVFSSVTEQWTKNRVLLMGDAVHTMTPTGAYGLNSALKDADVLAELLLRETIDETDCVTCAARRQQEVATIQAMQIEKEQSFSTHFTVMS